MPVRIAAIAALATLAGACGQDLVPIDPRNLDRPTSVVFACFGDVVLNAGTPDERISRTAAPIELCKQWAAFEATGEVPAGQEAVQPAAGSLLPVELQAFVIQPGKGTMALIRPSVFSVIDTDELTPGRNAISVGTLPIDGVADDTGCFAVTANAGSCDLSFLDITSAASALGTPTIGRAVITNAAGEVVDAKPRDIAIGPQQTTFGAACPARPRGVAYVAYPDCSLVAAVDLETGQIRGGVQFDESGAPRIVDGNVQCRSQCGGGNEMSPLPDGGMTDASMADAGMVDGGMEPPPPPPPGEGAPRPVTLELDSSGGRLYIGAENSPAITVVELDAGELPQTATSLVVEGEVGITKIAVSDEILMGGNLGEPGGSAGMFRFAYAIATDRTIRVLDLDAEVECDTQVDPRFIYSEADIAFLSCMPVGGAETPPRRAGARSPGIHTPRDSIPTDVELATLTGTAQGRGPAVMVGTFAFITTSDGFIHIVNIDDDNYADRENSGADAEDTFVSLAIPHQLRDFVNRNPGLTNPALEPAALRNACLLPDPSEGILPPRLATGVGQILGNGELAPEKFHEAPFPLSLECPVIEGGEQVDSSFVTEMAFAAPVALREMVFPDLRRVRNEEWFIVWEGPLSLDAANESIDGPAVRNGLLERSGNGLRLRDPSASLCELGVEPFDILNMVGCDPSVGDSQCGIGETCFVHPDSPATLPAGTCLPAGQTDILSGQCRDYLISRKRFSVTETRAGELELRPRRRVLSTTPIAGCVSDQQCTEMAFLKETLRLGAHPIEAELPDQLEFTWSCEADPSRAPGPDRCVMTCETADDCEPGFACSGGYCVEAPVPPAQCIDTVQRYQVRAGEAFAVVGDTTGYLHNRIVDSDGTCIDDPDGSPLNIGRIPLDAPDCPAQTIDAIAPNPCRVTMTQQERFIDLVAEDGLCVARDPGAGLIPRSRPTEAIRFSNPAFTFHLADVVTTGDADCIDDRQGTFPLYSAVHDGYQLRITLTGGFIPMFVLGLDPALRFPNSITRAPDGKLWVTDQGDVSSASRGQVVELNPGAASSGNFNAVQYR